MLAVVIILFMLVYTLFFFSFLKGNLRQHYQQLSLGSGGQKGG